MAEDRIAASLDAHPKVERIDKIRKRTLGNVRLRHLDTNEIILIPTPSSDPNDPLNWPQWYKYYIATVVCLAMMMCNFLAAGPSIDIVSTTMDFFPGANPRTDPLYFADAVAKVSYFFTSTALLQGVGNFFWVPVANKYGRRPTYVFSYLIYTASAIWLCFERSYSGFLAGRIIMGFGAGAAETVAPITIADIFFLHERGTVMALYTSFLAVGVALGIVISGLITIGHEWRVIYQVAAALVGFVLLLAFFAFPETAYIREKLQSDDESAEAGQADSEKDVITTSDVERVAGSKPGLMRESYLRSLKLFRQALTTESFLKLVVRPLGLICLPPVLWAALVEAATIGFLVAVTSNVAVAFQEMYGFEAWQVGLCFIGAIIGSIVGIPAGGHLGDKVADWFTRRNNGVRDPEMRLPAMIPCLIATPLSLILYGVGIEHKLHWICPTIGIALLNFATVQGTNLCLVYVIDAYRPIAGEVTLAVMGFKSMFGFLLSFYTNTWVSQSGYQNAYGVMAAISAALILLSVPLYFWGKRIRHVTWQWRVISCVHWNDDREVGE
ncbi:major facilitator superfamily domain-containing protein [Lasiosphaeria miniovina]|uniref:Major facilitator superfamily domain-containing protein n=1 Tax=Lasiosphaeria miniovina TaxID=1954250 RepID=A0AA40BH32_9PEZI|nr:major facilitator superfamily domain-containing protein [Lasiosphaeria miniovina]KAK0734127.1 major facilitator superfamily domain-containing protein [Lasiosphaeria miniovina]